MERRSSGNFLSVRYYSCCVMLRFFVLAAFCLILFKAFRLQIIEHRVWAERMRAQIGATLNVPSYRGSIYDRRGRLLSYSVPQQSLYANCDQVENPKALAASLAPVLAESRESVEKKLACGRRFVWLKRHLSDQQTLAVVNLKGRGLNLVNEYKRFYPYGQVAGQVLGFVGLDGEGLEGIERALDPVLRKRPVTVEQYRDGVRNCLWLDSEPPPASAESSGVRLTIDAFLQYLCERELEEIAVKYHAKAGEVIVTDPETSEVLAMANWPFFDPNLIDKKGPGSWRNRAITDAFEPGSTFKVFLVSAALEEGLIKLQDRIFCENGKFSLARHTINDVHPHGWLTIPEVIKYSSNIAASKLALQLGSEKYFRYIQAYGFGKLSGVGLPGETRGLLRPWKMWHPIDLATTGFGQSIGVTAMQLTLGVAAIAKGGEYYRPSIVGDILNSQGRAVQHVKLKSNRRVIQRKTAEKIRDMMVLVTQEGGTGVKAAPDGYTVAGKTGTAQVLDPETRRYSTQKYTSIFTGFIPADKPRLVMTVVIHEPHGAVYGGVVAAPVFRNVAARALPYLGTLPSNNGTCPPAGLRTAQTAPGEAPGTVAPISTKNKMPAKSAKQVAKPGDTVSNVASSPKTKGYIATSRRDLSKPPLPN